MIERLIDLVPKAMRMRSGTVFYSGRAAYAASVPLYLLGLNPGGDPVAQATETIGASLEEARKRREDHWSAYADECWRGRPAGTATMQPRVLHLLKSVGLDPRRVPASNVVFVRSARESALAAEKSALLAACWPLHEEVLRALRVRVVACMGGTAGRWVREMTGAHLLIDRWTERNARCWTSEAHANSTGLQVLTLTHPSVAAWNTSSADPSPLVRAALERAETHGDSSVRDVLLEV